MVWIALPWPLCNYVIMAKWTETKDESPRCTWGRQRHRKVSYVIMRSAQRHRKVSDVIMRSAHQVAVSASIKVRLSSRQVWCWPDMHIPSQKRQRGTGHCLVVFLTTWSAHHFKRVLARSSPPSPSILAPRSFLGRGGSSRWSSSSSRSRMPGLREKIDFTPPQGRSAENQEAIFSLFSYISFITPFSLPFTLTLFSSALIIIIFSLRDDRDTR